MSSWVWFKNRHPRRRPTSGARRHSQDPPSPALGTPGGTGDKWKVTNTRSQQPPQTDTREGIARAQGDLTGNSSYEESGCDTAAEVLDGRGATGGERETSGTGGSSPGGESPGGAPGGGSMEVVAPECGGSSSRHNAGPRNVHRSLHRLSKSPHVKVEHKLTQPELRITFNDSMTSTYEYPSEQSLLEELPPEPGDFDYIQQLHGRLQQVENPHVNEIDEPEDLNPNAGASLRSTPGIGSGGGLASYRSRYMDEYQLGVDIYTEAKNSSSEVKKPEPQAENEENVQVKPAEDEDTFNWSNAASSDLLF